MHFRLFNLKMPTQNVKLYSVSIKIKDFLADNCGFLRNFAENVRVMQEMNNVINISQTQIVLAFVATCIEATARTLGVSYREVFLRRILYL